MSRNAQAEAAQDIGGGHRVQYYVGRADLVPDINPLLLATRDDEGLITIGLIDWHHRPDGEWCGGAINFVPIDGRPVWTVHSLDPLDLSPSLLCSPDKGGCGDHGFIRQGMWQSV